MVIFINQKPRKKISDTKNMPWIALGTLVFSSLIIFLVAGASRSSEVQTQTTLQINSTYNTYLSDEQLRNLTQEFTNTFGAYILASLQGVDATNPSDAIIKEIEDGALDKTIFAPIDTSLLFGVEVPDEDILISQDNSEKAMLSYFGELSKIISYTKKEALSALEAGAETKNFGAYETAANLYAHAFTQTQKLIVPSFWTDIHKKELSLMAQNKKVFQAIANVDKDPVLSWRAMQHLIQLAHDGVALEKEIKTKGQEFLNKR